MQRDEGYANGAFNLKFTTCMDVDRVKLTLFDVV